MGHSYDGKSEQLIRACSKLISLPAIQGVLKSNTYPTQPPRWKQTMTTSNDPSGSLAINGMASQGKLNSLDTEDYWSMKLTGGEIYTVRATDFSQLSDVSLLVDHHELGWHQADQRWNWWEHRMLTQGYSIIITRRNSCDRSVERRQIRTEPGHNFIRNLLSHNHQSSPSSDKSRSSHPTITLENAVLEAAKNIASHSRTL